MKLSSVLNKKKPNQANHAFAQRVILLNNIITLLMLKILNIRAYNKRN